MSYSRGPEVSDKGQALDVKGDFRKDRERFAKEATTKERQKIELCKPLGHVNRKFLLIY